MKPGKPKRPGPAGQVRIIGGRWRGTKLPVPDLPGLRPSSDRVRETLFNWLMPALPGAKVLDLFAGTGVLGLEALSRGAAQATFVERDRQLAANLRSAIDRLQAKPLASVVETDATTWLTTAAGSGFDILFVDPPFAQDLWQRVLPHLAACAAADAWLYVESAPAADASPGDGWTLHREGSTRDVHYRLYRRAATA